MALKMYTEGYEMVTRSEYRMPVIKDRIKSHFTYWLGHPDKGSEFAEKIGWKKHIFRGPLKNIATDITLPYLRWKGHEQLVLLDGFNVAAHTAFQMYKKDYNFENLPTAHIYHVFTNEKYRRLGCATRMMYDMIHYAKDNNLSAFKLSSGGKNRSYKEENKCLEYLERICNHLSKNKRELGIEPKEKNYFKVLQA